MATHTPIEHLESTAYRTALEVVRTLVAAGHQALFAGGCVRDLLLGVEPNDFDVATSATPDVVQSLFARTEAVGAHFGVILVLSGHAEDRHAIEVATFRNDGAYTDGRRPDAVRFSNDPREDVLRRDITINGMLFDPLAFEQTDDLAASVLDFVNGREDLKLGIVRAIGDPTRRFTEDKLRMLRAVRFASRLGFEIEPATTSAIADLASEIHQVSAERIRDELSRMLTEGHARRAFELLDELNLLSEILPEAVAMHGVEQPADWHPEGDVWVHTMLLLEKLEPGCPATLAWGALLHDIGKPATYQLDRSGLTPRIRFNGHVEVGIRVTEVILKRLRFSNEDTEQIVALVKNHMRFGDVPQMKESTIKRFLRLPKFDEHLRLHWLDCSSCHGKLGIWETMKQRYEAEPAEEHRPQLLVTGRDLINAGYKPGTAFKAMLEAAEDAQLEGAIHTTSEGLALVRDRFNQPASRAASQASMLPPRSPDTCDVLVLGAGIAGLACARTLAERGLRVCLVEATDRVGGRILTHRVGGQVVELGAEFVHGRPPELLALISEAELTLIERTGTQVSFDEEQLAADTDARDGMFDPLEDLRTYTGPDLSFKDYLAQSRFGVNADAAQAALSYVEGFNAADATQISAHSLGIQQVAEDSIDGELLAHITEGYDRLPLFLANRFRAANGDLRLNTLVTAIHWGTGRVAFKTSAGELVATRAVITLPLGVLRGGTVRIVPQPRAILEASALMRMGAVSRFTLVFRERFWQTLPPQPAMHELSFLFAPDELPSVWWTTHPEDTCALTGWVGGPRSSSLLAKSESDLADLACRALARLFHLPESRLRQELQACLTHDWSADSNFRGSYSYVAVGGSEASARMAEPVEHTLYFAGEHTDTSGHWGTVHGALRSGFRAAKQILDTF